MSETYTIKYSAKAINDLRDIYSYIAFNLQAPETAANYKAITKFHQGTRLHARKKPNIRLGAMEFIEYTKDACGKLYCFLYCGF